MSVTLCTSLGDIKVELHCSLAPTSCANFLALCGNNTYTGTIFHRIAPNFMIQGGDPTSSGKTSIAAFARRLPDEIVPGLNFSQPGVLAMANKGRPSSKGVGSQFFITVAPATHLDGTCTIIGKVIHGLQVAESIAQTDHENGKPIVEVKLERVKIHANPFATGEVAFEMP